jgi:P27 family predicted phage terminase small subunit
VTRLPPCPPHLTPPAAREWRRVARVLRDAGVLTAADTAALAAYCQAWGRWVEAETRLREAPLLYKTPSGHVQQSPWLGIIHKQLELMGRYMVELGMTPASRSRVAVPEAKEPFNVWLERLAAELTERENARALPKLPGPVGARPCATFSDAELEQIVAEAGNASSPPPEERT